MKSAILVVTYNRKNLLLENIQAVLKQSCTEFDYYICDNASTDGTKEAVAEEMKKDARIHYHNTGSNLGGAGGFSYGLKVISQKDYDYCWIMDDDSIPTEDALERLLETAEKAGKEGFSFLASNVLWVDGSPCKMNQVTPLLEKLPDTLMGMELDVIDRCSFVGCFVNMYYVRKVGLPIKEFFIYGDDTEYTLRLSSCQKAFFCRNSKIIHKMPENSRIGIPEAPVERLDRYEYEYRNRIYIYRNRSKKSWGEILKIYMKETAKVLLRSRSCRIKRIRILWRGYRKGKKFHPDIEMIE